MSAANYQVSLIFKQLIEMMWAVLGCQRGKKHDR